MFKDFDPKVNLPIDPNDPSTWVLHADSTVDMGGAATRRVSYDVAITSRKRKYQELFQIANSSTGYAHGPQSAVAGDASAMLQEMLNPVSRSGSVHGYDAKMFPYRERTSRAFDAVLGNYYKDLYEGMDPFDAAVKHAQNLPYSESVKQGIIDRINYYRNPVMDGNIYVGVPDIPIIPEEEFNKLVEVEKLRKDPSLNVPENVANDPKVVAAENVSSELADVPKSEIPKLLDVDPNARIIPSSGNIIDDIIAASDDPNFGKALKDVLDKSDFLNREFNFPGANKAVTGAEILGHIKGVGFSEMVPGAAAFESTTGNIFLNPKVLAAQNDLMAQMFGEAGVAKSAEAAVFNMVHEIGHAGANLVGIDDPQKTSVANKLAGQMPDEVAVYMGQQEGIADSFAQEVRSQAGMPRYSGSIYDRLVDQVTGAQEMNLGRKLTLDEVNEIKAVLGSAGVQDVNVRAGLLSYLGVNAADQESLLKNVNSPKLELMSSAYDEIGTVKSQISGTKTSLPKVNNLEDFDEPFSWLSFDDPNVVDESFSPPPTMSALERAEMEEKIFGTDINNTNRISNPVLGPPKPDNLKTSDERLINKILDESNIDQERSAPSPNAPRRGGVLDVGTPKSTLRTAGPVETSAWIGNPPPTPKPVRNPVLDVGTPIQGSTQTSTKVVTSGTGTPQAPMSPPVAAAPTAQVNVPTSTPPSSGAPSRLSGTAGALANSNQSSKAVAQGLKGSKNLKMLGVAALVGLGTGAFAKARFSQQDSAARTQQDNIDRRLEMQRRGIIS